MGAKRCEFEEHCMTEENTICADAEHPEDCDTYHFAVRVHNATLENTKIQLMKWGMPRDMAERTIASLRKPSSQEGE